MSTRLKPYPSYKDSGVEWLGRIPAHWRVVRSDALLEYSKEQARRESFGGKRVFHYSIPAIQETGDGREEDGAEIDSDKISLGGDELLVSKLNPRKGCVLISKRHDLPVVCSTEFVPLRAKRCDLRFAFYLYASQEVRDLISATVQSVTRSHQRANPADITKIWLAFPPDAEQRAIASFLDRETGKIDALVAKMERLIELLQEKRTALISHAVTQGLPAEAAAKAGLNPNAPMKESGIPWLGRIPAHWEVKPLKRIGAMKGGSGFPDAEQGIEDEELPFYKVSDMNLVGNEVLMRSHNNSISTATARRLGATIFLRGAVVFPKVGAALLTNKRRILSRPACIDNNTMAFTVSKGFVKFLFYRLLCIDLGRLANPGAVPSLNEKEAGEIAVAVPPANEQGDVASFLDIETSKLDALTARVRLAVERLREYRTALISAAVTGQIDVRSCP